MNWLHLTITALTFTGLWGFLIKLGTNHINTKSLLIFEMIGFTVMAVILLILSPLKFETNHKGIVIGLLAGAVAAIATIALFGAISKERASLVVTLVALSPMITIFLSILFLNENLAPKEAVGIVLALVAMVLIAK